MGQNTFKALMNRGCDSETANRIEKAGYTFKDLKILDVNESHLSGQMNHSILALMQRSFLS
jgi:hypothetical protein